MLEFIYAYDTCSTEHVCTRFFGTSPIPGKYGPRVTCYRRLARLRETGYLSSYRLPSVSGVGSGKALLGLGPLGRKLLAEHFGLSRSELKHLKQVVTPLLGSHHLAVCDARLALELACEAQSGVTIEWVSERELRTPPITKVRDPRPQPTGLSPAEIPLIPDGQFTLTLLDGARQSFWLEVDQGTIPSKRMQTKLAGYLAHSPDSPILWVVPDARRAEAIASWARNLAERLTTDPSIFWISIRSKITSATVLGPVWRVVGGPAGHPLIPIGHALAGGPSPSIDVGRAHIAPAELVLTKGSGWRL